MNLRWYFREHRKTVTIVDSQDRITDFLRNSLASIRYIRFVRKIADETLVRTFV